MIKLKLVIKPCFLSKVKQFKSFFSYKKSNASPLIAYFYCMWKGHPIKNCKTRMFNVPNGLVKCMPKRAKEELTFLYLN